MRQRSVTHLVVAVATVFGASWLAYANLGGEEGVMLPYQGTLHSGGAAVNDEVTLTFEVWTLVSGGDRCLRQAKTFTPANGAFAVTLGPVNESCMKGNDLYLQILDPGGGPIGGRQRVHPAVAAVTSGRGDFHVTGALESASLTTGALDASGKTRLTGGATVSGVDGGTTLDVDGHTETGSLTVLNDTDLGAATAASLTVSGTLTTGELALDSLSVTGEVTWDCPADTVRVGDRCVTYNEGLAANQAGSVSYGSAVADCHSKGMTLCPLETIFMCDELNVASTIDYSCGMLTDVGILGIGLDGSVLTSTPFGNEGSGLTVTCFSAQRSIGGIPQANYRRACTAGQFYFCCSPVNPTTL